MLRINRNTSALTVSLLFGLLSTTSCGFDDGYDKEDTGDDNVKVAFRMAFVNDNTRAVNDGWEDYNPTDPGDAYENAINADQLQIKVCDKDGNIIGDVQDVRVIENQITGTWEKAGALLKKANKIMVFANCGTDNVTLDNISSLAFVNDNTRAVNDGWEDYNPTDPGDAYENAINADQLQIKVCDKDGNIIGDVQDVRVIENQITGTWEKAGALLKKANKIMVFANCGTDNVTLDNISSLAFRVDQTKQYIPMWGVTTLTKDLVVGKQNNLGTIDLLRSLAKVKVKMADGMKARGYALGSITFNNYNTEGFTLPLTYNTSKNTKEILFSGSLNAKPSWSQSVTMTNTTTDEESIMLYIPEYDNKAAAADRKASITLNLKCDGMDDGTYTLQFCNYVDGVADPSTLYNIQRNHYYEYTVNKDDRLNVTLKVQMWNKRTHSEIIM